MKNIEIDIITLSWPILAQLIGHQAPGSRYPTPMSHVSSYTCCSETTSMICSFPYLANFMPIIAGSVFVNPAAYRSAIYILHWKDPWSTISRGFLIHIDFVQSICCCFPSLATSHPSWYTSTMLLLVTSGQSGTKYTSIICNSCFNIFIYILSWQIWPSVVTFHT